MAEGAGAGKRVALVIGNAAYTHASSLANPANDAGGMAQKLETLGFSVTAGIDLGRDPMENALFDFETALRDAEVALLFYAGHGLQVKGENFLLPIDANIEMELHLKRRAFSLSELLGMMSGRTQTNLIFLDACRNNPFTRSLSRALGLEGDRALRGGLAEVRAAKGTFIAFATAPNEVALDGRGKNSPFTEAVLKHIGTPGLSVTDMMTDVINEVAQTTQERQEPWQQSNLRAKFYFKPTEAPVQPGADVGSSTLALAAQEWGQIKDTADIAKLKRFSQHFAGTYYAELAAERIAELEEAARAKTASEAEARVKAAAEAEARAKAEAERRRTEAQQREEQRQREEAGKKAAAEAERKRAEARHSEIREKIARATEREALFALWQEDPEAVIARLEALGFIKVASLKDGKAVSYWLKPGESFRDLDGGPEMAVVPAGSFMMGSKDNEGDADERPRHKVKIPAPFAVGRYPITVAEYMAGVKAGGCKPAEWLEKGSQYNIETGSDDRYKQLGEALKGDRFPIVGVSWADAKAYAAWLASKTGKAYRLLSEAEWEYACRAGREGAYCFGGDESQLGRYAWYASNSGGKTHPVGEKLANEWGLHDMHGNVWEWCEDLWHGDYNGAPDDGSAWTTGGGDWRVLRGGSWNDVPRDLRAACRISNYPTDRDDDYGLRVARTLSLSS